MKTLVFIFILACLAGLIWHAVRLPQEPGYAPQKQAKVSFQGGPGDSPATAVIIRGAVDGVAGTAAEYRYIRDKFGREDQNWRLMKQELLQRDDRVFDVMRLELTNGRQTTVYFDITDFFGKK